MNHHSRIAHLGPGRLALMGCLLAGTAFLAGCNDAQAGAAGAVLGAGGLFGELGADLGNIELQRDRDLLQFLSNPRDFEQLALSLGGGFSFLEQLEAEEPVTGRSTRLIGEQTLGPLFAEALASIMQRPELAFFEQAGERAGDIPTFEELAGVEVPEAFFPEGPPLPPEPGFVDPATVGADAAGLLPPPVTPSETRPGPPVSGPLEPGGPPQVLTDFTLPGLEGVFTQPTQQSDPSALSQVLEALRALGG